MSSLVSARPQPGNVSSAVVTLWPSLRTPQGQRRSVEWASWWQSPTFRSPPTCATPKALPGWSPATFTSDRRTKGGLERLCALVLDYDNGGSLDEAVALWGRFYGLLHTTYHHLAGDKDGKPLSPGPRFRVILVLSRPVTEADHALLWRWSREHARRAGQKIDEATKDASRLWFLPGVRPGHEAAYEVRDLLGEVVDVDALLAELAPSPQSSSSDPEASPVPLAYARAALHKAALEVAKAPPGTRNATLNQQAYALGGWHVIAKEEAQTALLGAAKKAGLPDDESRRTFENGFQAGRLAPRSLPWAAEPSAARAPRSAPCGDAHEPSAWQAELRCGKNGVPHATLANAITILANDPAWRTGLAYNEFSERVIVTKPPPWHPHDAPAAPVPAGTAWTDEDDVRLSAWLDRVWGLRLSPSTVAQAVRVSARRQMVHPVRDYLDRVHWDGVPRVERWLSTYLGARDTAYTRNVGRWWLLSAVARVMRPGCQADYILIFEGLQGIGKSSLLRTLTGEAWFCDDLGELGTKDACQQLRGKWIIELGELASLTKTEASTAKRFATTRSDHYRPSYGREARDFPRQCVFAGTSNQADYLRDPTGGRRFWPVACSKTDLDALARDRDQLWAEAVALYRQGRAWWPVTPEEHRACQEQQEKRRQRDAWEDVLVRKLAGRTETTLVQVLEDALELKKERWGRADQLRAAEALRALGWVRKQRRTQDDQREWVYVRSAREGGVTDLDDRDDEALSHGNFPAVTNRHQVNNGGFEDGRLGGPGAPPQGAPASPRSPLGDVGDVGDSREIPGLPGVTDLSPTPPQVGDTASPALGLWPPAPLPPPPLDAWDGGSTEGALGSPPGGGAPSGPEPAEVEERAAIAEYEGGLARAEAEQLAAHAAGAWGGHAPDDGGRASPGRRRPG